MRGEQPRSTHPVNMAEEKALLDADTERRRQEKAERKQQAEYERQEKVAREVRKMENWQSTRFMTNRASPMASGSTFTTMEPSEEKKVFARAKDMVRPNTTTMMAHNFWKYFHLKTIV